ncbi:MAG: hypothetical protein ACSHX8_14865 [Opitutaceae bacterium]
MNKLFINKCAVWSEPTPDDFEALAVLKAEFPGRSARRMTRLGMQMTHVLRELQIDTAHSLVYATTYSETCTIEKFLDSFPYPSPQAFQTSIHPSGVEQFLIQKKQSLTEFFPLAGDGDILFRVLSTAQLCQSEDVILCGGEERGTWLCRDGVSSELNYAWAVSVSEEGRAHSIGSIEWEGLAEATGDETVIVKFLEALKHRTAYTYTSPNGGKLEINWSDRA